MYMHMYVHMCYIYKCSASVLTYMNYMHICYIMRSYNSCKHTIGMTQLSRRREVNHMPTAKVGKNIRAVQSAGQVCYSWIFSRNRTSQQSFFWDIRVAQKATFGIPRIMKPELFTIPETWKVDFLAFPHWLKTHFLGFPDWLKVHFLALACFSRNLGF